jgi:hypothetical protein
MTEIAAEIAAWNALPQAEKDRLNAARDAKWESLMSVDPDEDEAFDDEDEETGL